MPRREPSDRDLEDYVGAQLLAARKLPVGRAETPAEEGLGKTWAVGPVGRTRDSGIAELSNFEAALEILTEVSEEDVEVLRFGHWGPGWIEELAWRAVDSEGRITAIAEAAYELHQRLESYPLLDEDDVSERESAVQYENVRQALRDFYNRHEGEIRGKFFAVWTDEPDSDYVVQDVYEKLWQKDQAGDEQRSVRERDLERALVELGLLESPPEVRNGRPS